MIKLLARLLGLTPKIPKAVPAVIDHSPHPLCAECPHEIRLHIVGVLDDVTCLGNDCTCECTYRN